MSHYRYRENPKSVYFLLSITVFHKVAFYGKPLMVGASILHKSTLDPSAVKINKYIESCTMFESQVANVRSVRKPRNKPPAEQVTILP